MRSDLRQEFPEVFSSEYYRLLGWALAVTEKEGTDSEYYTLKPFKECFEHLASMTEIDDPIIEDWVRKYLIHIKKTRIKKIYDFINWMNYILFSKVPLPEAAVIDPCNICNLDCSLCPSGDGKLKHPRSFMDEKTLNIVLNKLSNIRTVDLFNWGEPLLNPDIIKLIEHLKSRNILVTIHTNFNVKKSDAFFSSLINSGLDHLIISLDGASQNTYSVYRRNGDFNLVISNIKRLINIKRRLNATDPILTWKFIVNKYNEHELLKAKNMASMFDIKFIAVKMGLSDDLPDTIFDDDVEQRKMVWLPKDKKYIYDYYLGKYELPLHDDSCPHLFQQVCVTPNGKIFPCCWVMDEKNYYGDLIKQSFHEIWDNEKYSSSRRLFKFSLKKRSMLEQSICHRCRNYRKIAR